MRRLPIYFVLDCSESMIGDGIAKMEAGLRAICRDLRTDPNALETVFVSVIGFAGIAKPIVPLVELLSFSLPALPLGAGTNLGAALDVLTGELDRNIQATTSERKGDWRPIIYLFTDGRPTESPSAAVARWKSTKWARSPMIGVGFGSSADLSVLRQLTETVVLYSGANQSDFNKFVKWVSASVTLQSTRVSDTGDSPVAPLDPSVMKLVKDAKAIDVDDNIVTVVGRCSRTSKPYILKYDAIPATIPGTGISYGSNSFTYDKSFPINEDYFTWSDNARQALSVNTAALAGFPTCAHCDNRYGLALCSCGAVICVAGTDEVVQCPWCKQSNVFNQSGNFDVGRGIG